MPSLKSLNHGRVSFSQTITAHYDLREENKRAMSAFSDKRPPVCSFSRPTTQNRKQDSDSRDMNVSHFPRMM